MATVTVDRDGGVAWLRYAAPENRLTAVGLLRLRKVLDGLVADPSVRVVVLGGADGRSLTLMDPADGLVMADQAPPLPAWVVTTAVRWAFQVLRRSRALRRWVDDERWALRTGFLNTLLLADTLERGAPITVAAIHGPVFGGGMELALCCDLRFASDDAHTWLALPEVLAGVMVGFGSSQRLPRLVGRARALEMLLLCEPLDPARAVGWGLVNRVFPAAEFEDRLREVVRRLAARPAAAVAGTRRAVREGRDQTLIGGLSTELREVLGVWKTADARAGLHRVAATLAKESASGSGRTLPEWLAELDGGDPSLPV